MELPGTVPLFEVGNHAVTVRGPVDRAVVDADQLGVARQPDIAFERVGALVDCAGVGEQGVFGEVGRCTPVGGDGGTLGHASILRLPVPGRAASRRD